MQNLIWQRESKGPLCRTARKWTNNNKINMSIKEQGAAQELAPCCRGASSFVCGWRIVSYGKDVCLM